MSEVTVWNSITVKDSEDLKHDLLTGKVNMFRCPSCSYSALMPTPMLYHDEDKRLMISFSPCDDVVLKSQLFDNVQKETYDTIHKQLLESGMKPYSFGWEMVDASYATRLLNGFNN